MTRAACLLLLGLALLCAPAARADELYAVRDIGVDVSDVSAVEARRKALREAQMLGFHRLLRRLTLEQDWPRLPRLGFEQIRPLVRSLEIEAEKRSSTRYLANVTLTFDAPTVQGLLSGANIGFLEFSPLTILILPLYYDRDDWVLWRKPNPWWQAWSRLNSDLLATSYLLPLADLEDRLTLPTQRLAVGEDELLPQIAARYDMDRILLARAFPDPQAQGAVQVRVSLYRIVSASAEVTRLGSFTFQAPDMNAAAAHIAKRMEQDWKSRNIQEQNAPSVFRLRASFAGIEEWARMLRGLRAAAYLRSVQVEEMDIAGARLLLGFNGSGETLAAELQRNGFLVSGAEGDWLLRLAAAPAPEATAAP